MTSPALIPVPPDEQSGLDDEWTGESKTPCEHPQGRRKGDER
jgi:hypothetical protein